MAKYSNRQILAAVLNKWAQPAIRQLAGDKIGALPEVAAVEAWIKSTGWVSPMWKIGTDLTQLIGGGTTVVVEPLLNKLLEGIPDDMLPQLAHSIVNNGINNGGLTLFEGNVKIEVEDLEELSKYLRYNLPFVQLDSYQVLTEEPTPQGE